MTENRFDFVILNHGFEDREDGCRDFAQEIVEQMSDDDRASYSREAWRHGIGQLEWDGWDEGADVDVLLDHVDDVIAEVRS